MAGTNLTLYPLPFRLRTWLAVGGKGGGIYSCPDSVGTDPQRPELSGLHPRVFRFFGCMTALSGCSIRVTTVDAVMIVKGEKAVKGQKAFAV